MMNNDPSREPVIVTAARTAVGKAKRGSLATTRPEDMMAVVIKDLIKRADPLKPEEIDDLVVGCAFPEGEQGMNMSRLIGFRAELPISVPTETINRFCSSGVQSIAHAAFAIIAGQTEVAIAGGVESMSMVPMTGYKFAPNPYLSEHYPEAFTSMGITAENVSEQFSVNREDQDAFAFSSHQKAINAIENGHFESQIVPVEVEIVEPGSNGKPKTKIFTYQVDEGPRADTSLEALAAPSDI